MKERAKTRRGGRVAASAPPAATGVSPDAPLADFIHASLVRRLRTGQDACAAKEAARFLNSAATSLRAGSIAQALRQVDRAWRCLPEEGAALAPIFGHLLYLDGGDSNAALRLLQCALEFCPDPEIEALRVLTLLRLERVGDASAALGRALAGCCIEPCGLLARAAGELLRQDGHGAPGWVGRGPGLEVVGELAAGEGPNALAIGVDGGTPVTQMLPRATRDDALAFSVPARHPGIGVRLDVTSHGRALMGSGALLPEDFFLDGRAGTRGRHVIGWARVGWRPGHPPPVRISDERGRSVAVTLRDVADAGWRWRFDLDLRRTTLSGNQLHVAAQLPDGRWHPLPDAPLILEAGLRSGTRKPARLKTWRETPRLPRSRPAPPRRAQAIDVIIPVHRSREETLACLASVLATVDERTRVIVVDDASDDPALTAALDAWEAGGHISLLRNPKNLGFVASVNRGLAVHPTHDAVLLNSDTRVFGDWLMRLYAAAHADPRTGTVTPLSNSGSIASYPNPEGGAVDAATAADLARLAAATLPGTRVEIPVGVGFCLYLRRDCLRDVGDLDAALFGKGYGEETDFCLRARQRGWSHRLAADVFVYHAGGTSFQGRRRALLERSGRLVNLRHPGYDAFVQSFLAQDPLRVVRRRLDERRLLGLEGRFVLLVTLAMSGGVDRFVADRCRALAGAGRIPVVLRPLKAGDLTRCTLTTDVLELPNLTFIVTEELDDLATLLHAVPWESIEIQHFLHLDARVIELVRSLSAPYDVVVHDYSWICPRITLIDASNRYCGEPALTVCESCQRRLGSVLDDRLSVAALRARSAVWLRGARRVVAPSADTAARLRRYVGGLDVEVRPHRGAPIVTAARTPRAAAAPLRVVLIGAIGTHKGYRILLACARDARVRQLNLEFVVIGHTENDAPLLATGRVFVTGEYQEPEAPHLIRRESPDIAWLPSVSPETWSYALDYALGAGLPVAAFDLGAIAERLRNAEARDLMPLTLDARRINDRLLAFGERHRTGHLTILEPRESGVPAPPDDASMAANNTTGMRMTNPSAAKASPDTKKDEALSASVQVLPLPAGLYLFSVKAATPQTSTNTGQLALPAMHVGLGPGVRADQVEFLSGPSTQGAWLFSAADLLVTRITGAGATLILTSVRAPVGDVLAIKVERLEDRALEPAAAPLPAKAPAPPAGAAAAESAAPVFRSAADDLPLPVHVMAHIRSRGDLNFTNVPWAGRVAPGLWIESFAVRPLERFGAGDIEYKGLTGSGFETPWLSDNKMCGTKGMATPLVGFALRLRPSPMAAAFDCEYSGYFASGVTVGPLRNGAPCRSTVANDSLEGIQVRLVKRAVAPLPEAARNMPAPKGVAAKSQYPMHKKGNGAAGRAARSTRRQPNRRP